MRRARFKRKGVEMLPEYDFSAGVRGKYSDRFTTDAVMVVLDPDVAEVFPDPKLVNSALRALSPIIRNRAIRSGRRRAGG